MNAWWNSLERIGVLAGPGAAGFLRWWRHSLLAWVPQSWQRWLGLERGRLLLSLRAGRLQVLRASGGTLQAVAELPWPCAVSALATALPAPLETLPRYWLLAPGQVLQRRLRLPAAAAARLHDVAGFEIDRQTPFTATEVYFDVRVLPAAAPACIEAELLVAPRHAFDGERGLPAAWRATLAGIDVADAAGRPLHVNLLPPALRRRQRDPQRRRDALLALATVLLLVLAGARLLDNRRAGVAALQAQLQARTGQARALARERRQLEDLVAGAEFLQRECARHPPAVAVWDELTRRLPAGTYLEKFSMQGSQLQLIGFSNQASALVRRLEGSPLWHAPALAGVLRSDAEGADRFTITAELAGSDAGKGADDSAR